MAKTREEITSNIDNMKQYLKDAYLLAKEWDCAERQIAEINRRINGLGHKGDYGKPSDNQNGKKVGAGGIIIRSIIAGVVGLIVGFVIVFFLYAIMFFHSNSNVFLVLVVWLAFPIIGVISTIKLCIMDNKAIDDKHQEYLYRMRNHEQKIREDEIRVQNELALIPKYRELEKIYSQNSSISLNALNRLLDLDIIFPKYRNLVAISQIYEYFMSGRCTELEGPHGAYNLYEHEIRMNIIITQLDTIIVQLEQIKEIQYMIYAALCETNARLANIESNTAAAALNTSVIAANSEIIARYYK